jgi:O-6-methylguanine DNA methyltransferase
MAKQQRAARDRKRAPSKRARAQEDIFSGDSARAAWRPAEAAAERDCVWRYVRTSLGMLALCASPVGVRALKFVPDAEAHRAQQTIQQQQPAANSPAGALADAWLQQAAAFIDPPPGSVPPALDIPLDVAHEGTPFQRRVWARLAAIPRGQTATYGALARELRTSPRALGQAMGRNPVALRVPCHRVVAAGGALGGFAWGAPIKRALLHREGVERAQEGA